MRNHIWFLFLLAVGCAGGPQRALERIHEGMDKDQVLETADNPKRTFREKGVDHWIYVYFADDLQWSRDVVFEDGKVIKITHPVSHTDWQKDLENADSLEEYEAKARAHQGHTKDSKDSKDPGESKASEEAKP